MRINRMKRLSKILTELQDQIDSETKKPKVNFNMGRWYSKNVEECGTACCAFGYATLDETFREMGLYRQGGGTPAFKTETGFLAAKSFFDITYEESLSLFDPTSYMGNIVTPKAQIAFRESLEPKDVVKRIERMIKKYQRRKKK